MIRLPQPLFRRITDAAEAAYPDECCGLLVGYSEPSGALVVTRVEASPNVAEPSGGPRFEVAAQLQFDLIRELRDKPEDIVGYYHSHPDLPAIPSERDLDMAFYPDLVALITSVKAGEADHTAAYFLDRTTRRFREVSLIVVA